MSNHGMWKFGDTDDMIKRHFEAHAEAYADEWVRADGSESQLPNGFRFQVDKRAIYKAGFMKSLELVLSHADTARAHIATLTKLYNKERARADAADADIKAIYAAQNG